MPNSQSKRLILLILAGIIGISIALVVSWFVLNPPPKKAELIESYGVLIVKTPEGGSYMFNQILLDMTDDATDEDVEEIIRVVNGRISRKLDISNEYLIIVDAASIEEFQEIIETLASVESPQIESVRRNILMEPL